MTFPNTLRAVGLAALLAVPATAQDTNGQTTPEEVRTEISQAIEAIAAYSEQERDEALAEAREVLDRLDAEIAEREQALRENWADMSAAAQETAQARLQELRDARNRLGERFGALEAGASAAWDELKDGFTSAWSAFSDAWRAADTDMGED
jgi:ribosomal protein S20